MAMTIGAGDKKKLILLGGLFAAIGIVVVVLYLPKGKTPEVIAPAAKTDDKVAGAPVTPTPGAGAPGADAAPPAGGGGAAPGGITAASLVSVERYRSDPFEPFAKPTPIPTPTPRPLPPPPGPVVLARPLEIVSPGEMGNGGYGLPPLGVNRTGGARPLADLPPIRPRRVAISPTAPQFFAPPGGQSGGGGILRSQNKRLSGVVIGDSVRALLVISSGQQEGQNAVPDVTRVVQPGDEVDGIRILRLERVNEGGRVITRLIIRENNEEQYVELRPAPQAAGAGGGALGGPPRIGGAVF